MNKLIEKINIILRYPALVFSFLFFSYFPFLKAEWHENDAEYLLEIEQDETSDSIIKINLQNLIFPSGIENGITARNENGEILPFHLDNSSQILFVKNDSKENIFVYFGFKNKHSFSNWNENENGPIPETTKLQLSMTRAWFDNTREDEIIKNDDYIKYLEIKKINDQLKILQRELKSSKNIQNRTPKAITEEEIKKIADKIKALKDELYDKSKELGLSEQKITAFRNKEEALENNFNTKNRDRKFETKALNEILLTPEIIPDKRREFACRVTGVFNVEKEDTYSFAINSTSYSLLTIDDIPILEWNYIHNKSNDWEKVAEKKLTPGKHILKFYAHIGEKSQYAAAAWKKPGEDKFSIIKFDDFYSPQELSIKSCYSKNTNKVPLVKGKYIGKIYTDRLNYLNLADCSVITNVSDIIPEWKLNSTKLHTGLSLQFLVQNETNDELILSYPSEDNTYDLEFKIPLSKLKKNDSVISPEIFMDLSIPLFLFDDELLEINTSIYSLVQQEIKTIFKVQSFPENELISSYTEFLELPAKQQTGDKIFSSPEIIKRNFKLDGKKISNQVILAKFSITIPPIEIKETYISIIPLERLNNFSSDGIFLTDSRDRRIIVKLHRPTLSEKREWSFVDSISNELKLFPKTLIISDDFGVENNTFFKNLSTHIGKTTQLDFIEWKSKKNNSTM
ncbi:MAG TPA: hypothetical protein PLJ44_07150, partial [Victivallales bacterium]|nr:hypothetical protein [Victivallales bacterium]